MLKEIETRQSIRRYVSREIPEAVLKTLLRAAMNAPSARNEQCWRFWVIRSRDRLDQISELSPYMKMMKSAPCCILVLADASAVLASEYMYYDCSAAIENLLIEAVHQGLGTCWCAIGPSLERIQNFKEAFSIPAPLVPISAVAVGYADEEKPLVDRYDETKIRFLD